MLISELAKNVTMAWVYQIYYFQNNICLIILLNSIEVSLPTFLKY